MISKTVYKLMTAMTYKKNKTTTELFAIVDENKMVCVALPSYDPKYARIRRCHGKAEYNRVTDLNSDDYSDCSREEFTNAFNNALKLIVDALS